MLTLTSFIFIVGVLVTIHELGHFLAARFVGVFVEKFYIGFNAFGYGWKKIINGTEYGIGWLPLGGYVKVAGMIDESLDPDSANISNERKFKYKPMWAKIFILSGGVIMNFLLSIFIFTFLIFQTGTYDIDQSTTIGTVVENYPAKSIGIRDGDKIISVNNLHVQDWESMTELINKNPNEKLLITWIRGEKVYSDSLVTKTDNRIIEGDLVAVGMIGVSPLLHNREVNLFEAFGLGLNKFYSLVEMMSSSIKLLLLGKVSINEMAGPLMIAKVAGETAVQGMYAILGLMAFLSINLGLINILPVPGLDGGHIAIVIVEKFYGQELPIRVKMAIQQFGMLLLLLLFITIMINDISRIF